jgi:hypothetical protein
MMPPAAFPGEVTAIGVAAESARRNWAAMHDTGAARNAANVRSRSRTSDTRSWNGPRRTRTCGMRTGWRSPVRRLSAAATHALGMCRERKDRESRRERKDDFGIHS